MRTYAPCDDRMAGVSPPALCARAATRILPSCCRQAVASSSQIGDRNVGRCSPLEGESSTPPRRRTKPGPQGPGFLLGVTQKTEDEGQTTDNRRRTTENRPACPATIWLLVRPLSSVCH